jgi:hypothetical protein
VLIIELHPDKVISVQKCNFQVLFSVSSLLKLMMKVNYDPSEDLPACAVSGFECVCVCVSSVLHGAHPLGVVTA